jgi:hypothetical protein
MKSDERAWLRIATCDGLFLTRQLTFGFREVLAISSAVK